MYAYLLAGTSVESVRLSQVNVWKPVEGRGYEVRTWRGNLVYMIYFCIIFRGISCPNEAPEFFYTFCIYLYTICEYFYQI